MFIARHALDIREHYERKLERANNLYMELSAIMLQLEMREKELIKYVSGPMKVLVDVRLSVSWQKCTTSPMLLLYRTDRCFLSHPEFPKGCAVQKSLPPGGTQIPGGPCRSCYKGTHTALAFAVCPAAWCRDGLDFQKNLVCISGSLLLWGK